MRSFTWSISTRTRPLQTVRHQPRCLLRQPRSHTNSRLAPCYISSYTHWIQWRLHRTHLWTKTVSYLPFQNCWGQRFIIRQSLWTSRYLAQGWDSLRSIWNQWWYLTKTCRIHWSRCRRSPNNQDLEPHRQHEEVLVHRINQGRDIRPAQEIHWWFQVRNNLTIPQEWRDPNRTNWLSLGSCWKELRSSCS